MKQTLKYALTLFAFFLLRGVLFSQNQIIGKVVNDKAEAVAFANILLFKAVDSSFVKGQIAKDDGTYLLGQSLYDKNRKSVTLCGYMFTNAGTSTQSDSIRLEKWLSVGKCGRRYMIS